MKPWVTNALERMAHEGAVLVVTKGGESKISRSSGIAPLMELLADNPDFLRGSSVVDRVVGRAAALLMAHGGVRELHAVLVSEPAIAALTAHGIAFSYDEKTPYIQNRTKDGNCPMESACLGTDDPAEAYEILKKKLAEMRGAAKTAK